MVDTNPVAAGSAGPSYPPQKAQFPQGALNAPTASYVSVDDQLYVRVHNALAGVTLGIRARMLVADTGQIVPYTFNVTPASNRTSVKQLFPLTEGYLISIEVVPDVGTPRRGQCFVEVGLVRGLQGTEFVEILFADYVTSNAGDGYPGGLVRDSVEANGMLRSITGTDPGAGVEISETVPTGARWQLRGVRWQLVTSAAAANRRPHLVVDDGANIIFDFAGPDVQAASLTRNYNADPWGFQPATQDNELYLALPEQLMLFQGWRIRTVTTALDAGDNFGPPRLYVEEWMED